MLTHSLSVNTFLETEAKLEGGSLEIGGKVRRRKPKITVAVDEALQILTPWAASFFFTVLHSTYL